MKLRQQCIFKDSAIITLFIKFVEHLTALKKKVLFLTKKVPFPSIDGECLVIKQDIQMCLDASCEVFVLSLNTDKHYVSQDVIAEHLPSTIQFHSVDIDTRINAWDAIKNLSSEIPYNIARFNNHSFLDLIFKTIASHNIDIIVFEGLHLAVYASPIQTIFKKKCIMRSHNVESEIWKRRYENEKNILRKGYLFYLYKKVWQFEKETFKAFDLHISISERDLEHHKQMGLKGETCVVPFTLNPTLPKNFKSKPNSIFFLGSFDWEPNYSGISWFIKNVWTLFYSQNPDWTLFLAGRNFPVQDEIFKNSGIEILGEVKDATELFNAYEVMIVPLFSGSGIRIKIIEAMFAGNVIVSTIIGAEGIYNKESKGIIIAEDATQFIAALQHLVNHSALRKELGRKNKEQASIEFLYTSIQPIWKKALGL